MGNSTTLNVIYHKPHQHHIYVFYLHLGRIKISPKSTQPTNDENWLLKKYCYLFAIDDQSVMFDAFQELSCDDIK